MRNCTCEEPGGGIDTQPGVEGEGRQAQDFFVDSNQRRRVQGWTSDNDSILEADSAEEILEEARSPGWQLFFQEQLLIIPF